MTDQRDIDDHSGVETTQHEWDGIKELNNPLPRWWLWIFYATVIWSVIYWVFMPAWPTLSGYTQGLWGHSDRENVAVAIADLQEGRALYASRLNDSSLEVIRANPELLTFAYAAGEAAFGDNCATCHGRGAQGFAGYPSLNDDVWLWGGTLDDIMQTIRFGIRADHPDTRFSQMPAFGTDGILSDAQIDDVTEYVVSLSSGDADAAAASRGAVVYEEQCSFCHGQTATGMRELGAPNLTDAEWLYGGDRETIRASIYNARYGVMPAWEDRLDPAMIRALAIWVHEQGGGED